jgi:hypothetical protein
MRVRFADAQHGLVLDLINLDGPSVAHYTTNGGQTAADWTTVVLDPAGGWFGIFQLPTESRGAGLGDHVLRQPRRRCILELPSICGRGLRRPDLLP